MLSVRNLSSVLFLLFLVVYTFQKYVAVPQQGFDPRYAINVGIIVALTAILPYLITKFVMRSGSMVSRITMVMVLPIVISTIGFAIYYFLFIAPNFADVPIKAVLPRSAFPGITVSAILILSLILNRKKS